MIGVKYTYNRFICIILLHCTCEESKILEFDDYTLWWGVKLQVMHLFINVFYIRWWFFDLESVVIVMYCNSREEGTARTRVSSKQNFRFEPKQTETRSVSVVFPFVSWNQKQKKIGLFRCFEPISKQLKQTELFRKKTEQTDTTLNFLKNTKICSLSNTETLCFDIEP